MPQWSTKLKTALGVVREADAECTLVQLQIFLHIYDHPDCEFSDLEREFDVGASTVSRVAARLSSYGRPYTGPDGDRKKIGGLGLIEIEANPDDRRRNRLVVTSKGSRLIARLEAAMG